MFGLRLTSDPIKLSNILKKRSSIILVVQGELWFYVGQSTDVSARMQTHISKHSALSTFLYFLWSKASQLYCTLPILNDALVSGPLLNILEQWLSLVFRALQPSEMKSNLSTAALRVIPFSELQRGVGVREPLAQNFSFADYPMAGSPFQFAEDPLKQE